MRSGDDWELVFLPLPKRGEPDPMVTVCPSIPEMARAIQADAMRECARICEEEMSQPIKGRADYLNGCERATWQCVRAIEAKAKELEGK